MGKLRQALPILLLALTHAAPADELSVARQALRDGLYDVARRHAEGVPGDTARQIVLESHALENHWDAMLSALRDWGHPTGDVFTCYRAAALLRRGDRAAAAALLDGATFSDAECRRRAGLLQAELLLANGKASAAADLLRKTGGNVPEAQMLLGEALAATGDRIGAVAAWRAVVEATNAPAHAVVLAAAKADDPALLRLARTRATATADRRFAALRLGVRLLKDAETFAEGARLVAETAADAPDAEGARAAMLALADARLERREFAEALACYDGVLETWPPSVRDPSVQEGRGLALTGLGRHADALACYKAAEQVATDAEAAASAAVRQADAQAALGNAAEATAGYRSVRAKYPKTAAAARLAGVVQVRELEERGRTLYDEYRFSEAAKCFDEAATRDPSRAERMAFCRMLCLYGEGRDGEAEQAARALIAGARDATLAAEATLWLAKLAYNRGECREAAALFAAYADRAPKAPGAPEALAWSARAAFAGGDAAGAIAAAARLATDYPTAPAHVAGLLVQGEALIELARFDEASLVLERAVRATEATDAERRRARLLQADALFAMGTDNPARYAAALEAYRAIQVAGGLSPDETLVVAFKIARTLERLKRTEEAIDQYYAQVVLAYRDGVERGVRYGDAAKAGFARSALWLADEFESRGRGPQAANVLELLATGGVPASAEAQKRLARLKRKGRTP